MRTVSTHRLLAAALWLCFFNSPSFGEFGTPLRPPSFNGHIVYRAVASQPGNTTSYLAVGRAWAGSGYQGIISSILVDGGWRNGSFTKGNTAWYPGQKLFDFSGAGFDNLCNAAVYAYDGFIVACRSMKSNGYYDIYLVKVNASGTLDTSFGTSGILTTGIAGNSTDGHAFVRGIVYNSAVNTSHNGLITVVGSVGTNSSNYRPFAASFDQQTGAAWGSTTKITAYAGTAVGAIYDSTTSNAYYIAATETVAPHHIYVHKYTYSGNADTSLDAASSPWGTALSLSSAGGGAESIPTGIALGTTGAWGVDVIVGGSNKTSSSSGNWVCTTVALESSTGNLRSGYGDAGTDNLGVTLLTHDASHDCIVNSVTSTGSGQVALLGAAYTSSNSNYDQLALKLDTNGTAVSGFGTSGFKLVSSGPANDVNNTAVLIGSYIYTGGRVDNASLYQGGDLQRYAISNGAVSPIVSSVSANSPSISSGQAVGMTVTATYADGSTSSVPLSSMNLTTSNSSAINLNNSSPYVYSTASAGSPTITAVLDETFTAQSTVSISVPGYATANIRADWDAAYADRSGPYASPSTTWYDLTSSGYDGTTNNTSHASWVGSGTYSAPYCLSLDGQGYVNFGTNPLASQTKMMFSSWVKTSNVNSTADGVILGNSSNASGSGFTVREHPSYRDVVMSLSPRGYWRLGESSGTTAADETGNGNTGTYAGGYTLKSASALSPDPDYSATFNGSTAKITTTNSNLNPTSAITLTAWIKPSGSSQQPLMEYGNSSSYGVHLWQLTFDKLYVNFVDTSNGNHNMSSGTSQFVAGTWYFVAATYNGSQGVLYVDGVATDATTLGSFTMQTSYAFNIGHRPSGGGYYYNGVIDDVAVFPTALSTAQIASLYRAGKVGKTVDFTVGKTYETAVLTDSPVAYWRLGDASGSKAAHDSSGNGNIGTYTSTTLGSTSGLSGDSDTAATFSSSRLIVPSSTNLQSFTSMSLEAWVYPTSWPASGHSAYIISKSTTSEGAAGSDPYNIWVLAVDQNGKVGFTIATNSAGSYKVVTTATGLSLNTWSHVVGTYNGSVMKVYINGTADANTTSTSLTVGSNTNTVRIGAWVGSSGWEESFTGKLDEIAIYNTGLTQTQVTNHYNAASSSNAGMCRSTSSLSDNLWTHISGIFSGSAATLYINGRQECTASISGGFTSPSTALYAGATSTGTVPLTGSIADVKIYGTSNGSTVGTSTDVKSNFDFTADTYREKPVGSIVTSNLLLHLDPANAKQGLRPFPIGCNSTDLSWFDISSSALTGTLTSFASCGSTTGWNGDGTTAVSSTAGPYRLTLDGSNDYVALTSNGIITDTNGFTVSGWLYHTNAVDYATVARLKGTTSEFVWANGKSGSTGTGGASVFFGFRGQNSMRSSVSTYFLDNILNKWYHYAITYNGSGRGTAGNFTLYINGRSVAFSSSSTVGGSGNLNEIGRDTSGGYFQGSMGNVMVYDRALSQTEISQTCTAKKSRYDQGSCNDSNDGFRYYRLRGTSLGGYCSYNAG
ncbi:hypothetical protein K2X33_03385, partial [bacterium]|nr:hypothetical protein [bacterium]